MNAEQIKLMEIYNSKLKLLNYSSRTVEIYSHYAYKFLSTINKRPQYITSDDFNSYISNYKYTSISQQNQIINAVKFLYDKVLERKYNIYFSDRTTALVQFQQKLIAEWRD